MPLQTFGPMVIDNTNTINSVDGDKVQTEQQGSNVPLQVIEHSEPPSTPRCKGLTDASTPVKGKARHGRPPESVCQDHEIPANEDIKDEQGKSECHQVKTPPDSRPSIVKRRQAIEHEEKELTAKEEKSKASFAKQSELLQRISQENRMPIIRRMPLALNASKPKLSKKAKKRQDRADKSCAEKQQQDEDIIKGYSARDKMLHGKWPEHLIGSYKVEDIMKCFPEDWPEDLLEAIREANAITQPAIPILEEWPALPTTKPIKKLRQKGWAEMENTD